METNTTEQVWKAHRQELRTFINSKVHDLEVTEDILQEAFIKIHLNLDSLKQQSKVRSWVFQITRNLLNDHFRKNSSFKKVDTSLLHNHEQEEGSGNTFFQCMLPFVDKLPAKYREALIFSDIKEMGQTTLAQNLRISYSGAKSRVQRARQMLRSMMEDCCKITADKYGNIVSHEPKGKCLCATT